ncbi:unnamed protein product [Calypogeia fissa]
MATFQDLGTSAGINIGIMVLFLVTFSILRIQPQNARVYFPKWYITGVRKAAKKDPKARKVSLSRCVNLDYRAYLTLFSWMGAALKMSEEDLIDHAGLDSAAFLRIFLLGLKIFLPIAGMGFTVLIPINVTDHNLVFTRTKSQTSSNFQYSEVDKLSIANVKDKSQRLWAHLLMSYLFTIWTCILLYLEFRTIANMRIRHLVTRKRAPDQFTVLVQQVPPVPGKSIKTVVEGFCNLNHPDYLLTEAVYNTNRLATILKKIEAAENWLQYCEIKYEKNPTKRPTMKTGFWGLWGETVDAMDYYTEKITILKQQARLAHEVILTNSKLAMPAAFVSFKSRRAAAICAQTQQTSNTTKWITGWAPEPRDVYWRNLAIPYFSLTMRKILMLGALLLLLLFYLPPILFVQSLANLDSLQKNFKFLRPILQNSHVKSILEGFLPGLALKIFVALLPMILMAMSKFEGHLSRSALDQVSAAKFYYFLLVGILLATIITGSLAGQLKVILESKSVTDILTILGNTVPMKATYFITYLMVDGWSGMSLEIIRLIPLIIYHIKNLVLVRTPKDRDRAMAPGNLLLDQSIPRLEFYFLVGIVYSVMTPLIVPFIITFFSFGYLVYRNQVINVYDPDYDSAAAFWPHVHSRIIVGLILEQLTLIGVFTIKGPIGFVKEDNLSGTRHKVLKYVRQILSSTPFMILLPIGTLIFHYYCRKRFNSAFERYPINDAAAKDRQEMKDFPNLDLKEYLDKAYLNPALKAVEDNIFREPTPTELHDNQEGDIEAAGANTQLLKEEDAVENKEDGSKGKKIFRDPSLEFQDALSRQQSLQGANTQLLKEDEEVENKKDGSKEEKIFKDPSLEFQDALSRQRSLQGDESPNSF